MRRTRNLGEFLKARREALGLTRRSLAQRLGVEASYIAYIEMGRRRPSLKLIAGIADTLGEDRQEVLLLARPEWNFVLSRRESETPPTPPLSWQRFSKNTTLLSHSYVTKRELQVLRHLNQLGTAISAKEFLAILTLIRDIPERE
jgi:transcriptional regulator with XRE-family HTH domain